MADRSRRPRARTTRPNGWTRRGQQFTEGGVVATDDTVLHRVRVRGHQRVGADRVPPPHADAPRRPGPRGASRRVSGAGRRRGPGAARPAAPPKGGAYAKIKSGRKLRLDRKGRVKVRMPARATRRGQRSGRLRVAPRHDAVRREAVQRPRRADEDGQGEAAQEHPQGAPARQGAAGDPDRHAARTPPARASRRARRSVLARATPDWDLALIAGGDVLNGGAGPGADELADSRVRRGQRVDAPGLPPHGRGPQRRDPRPLGHGGPHAARRRLRARGSCGCRSRSAGDQARLAGLGLDTTDHPAPTYQDVLLHSAADERRLRAAGFTFAVRVGDVLRQDRANRRAERARGGSRTARAAATVGIPSGRTSYRTLPEIEQELKALAAANPGLVRMFTLPLTLARGPRHHGRRDRRNGSGRAPTGGPSTSWSARHHAREWPANEATLEFALELSTAYKTAATRELRAASSRARARYVIPVLNVDGFNATIESEGLNPDGSFERPGRLRRHVGRARASARGAYKRKTCSDWGNTRQRGDPLPRADLRRRHADRVPRPRRRPEPQLRRGVGRPGHRERRRRT